MDKPHNFGALIRIEDAIKVLCRKTCHPGAFCPDVYCSEMWEAFDDVERVDAIPVSWIEKMIERLMSMNSVDAAMTAGDLAALVDTWRKWEK